MSNNELINIRFVNFVMKYKNLLESQVNDSESINKTSLRAFVDSALLLAQSGLQEMNDISMNAARTPKEGAVITGVLE